MADEDNTAARLDDGTTVEVEPGPVELPRAPRSASRTTPRSGHHRVEVDSDGIVTGGLRRVAETLDAHPATVVAAGFLVALGRYGNRRDAHTLFRTPDRSGSTPATTITVNWSPTQTFGELVRAVAGQVEHAIGDASRPGGQLDGGPAGVAIGAETCVRLCDPATRSEAVPACRLVVDVTTGRNVPIVTVIGSPDHFDRASVERVAGHLRTVLAAASENPEALVDSLPLLPQDEWEKVVRSWNRTQRNRPDTTLHELINVQVERTPGAVAVDSATGALTYAELQAQAESWSQLLRSNGVARGQIVAVCMPRGTDMVAAVLAVMRCGAAYLPIDPQLPDQRVAFMLRDSAATVVMCTHETLSLVDGHTTTVLVPTHAPIASSAAPPVEVSGDAPAYVLYTSGSTGAPKAVVITHRNAVNLVTWVRDTFTSDERRRILAATSLSWDLSITELFGSLCWGTTAVIVRDVLELTERPEELDVTWVNTSPSLIGLVVDRVPLPASVRVVTLAGEVTSRELATRIHERSSGIRLWIGYGPTETTTYSTFSIVDAPITATPSIGRPIDNNQVYLLDDRGEPVPIGCVGEIVIGGTAVAAGYLGRPELTAERFVPDPHSALAGARMYHTGDYARCASDGAHEFVGRRDDQVKIHGVRIELGEIESNLLALPGVHQAIVTVQRDASNGARSARIIAHVVPVAGGRLDAGRLRAELASRLPRHMVPAAVMTLDSLPLNPNGKVDRAELPEPPAAVERTVIAERRPRDALGQLVASIVQAATGTDRQLMMDDDFFDLGGDSLAAVVMFAEFESRCGVSLPVATLFEHATVGALVDVISATTAAVRPALSSPTQLRPGPNAPALFLMPVRTGGVLVYRDLIRHLGGSRAVYGLQSPGLDGRGPAARTLNGLATALADDIAVVQGSGPYLLAGFSFGGMVALAVAGVLRDRGHLVALVSMLDVDPFGQRPVRPDDPQRASHRGLAGVRRALALRRDRLRGRWWNATRGRAALNPRLDVTSEAERVLAINVRIADGWRVPMLEFPTALINGQRPGETFPQPPRRRCRAPVRTAIVEFDGAWHNQFLLDPQAADVAAELDAAIDWALSR